MIPELMAELMSLIFVGYFGLHSNQEKKEKTWFLFVSVYSYSTYREKCSLNSFVVFYHLMKKLDLIKI